MPQILIHIVEDRFCGELALKPLLNNEDPLGGPGERRRGRGRLVLCFVRSRPLFNIIFIGGAHIEVLRLIEDDVGQGACGTIELI